MTTPIVETTVAEELYACVTPGCPAELHATDARCPACGCAQEVDGCAICSDGTCAGCRDDRGLPMASAENGVAAGVEPEDEDDGLGVVSVGDEWYSAPPPPMQWLLRDARSRDGDGVLPRGKVGLLVAPGGQGKTGVLCQLALAVATGTRWLNAWKPLDPGRVLVLLGEEDVDEARRRLHRASSATDSIVSVEKFFGGARRVMPDPGMIDVAALAGQDVRLLERGEQGEPEETQYLEVLRDRVARHDYALVIADPLSRFGGAGAETDNAWGTRFIAACESIAATGATVLVAHHTAQWARRAGPRDRDETTSARGVTALTDGARWVSSLTSEILEHEDPKVAARLGEVVSLAVTKSNYAAKPSPILCRRDPDHGGALVPLSDEDRALVERARTGEGKATKREAVRQEATSSRQGADDAAARTLRAEMPSASHRDLTASLKARLKCGTDRADAALRRTRHLHALPGENPSTKKDEDDDQIY